MKLLSKFGLGLFAMLTLAAQSAQAQVTITGGSGTVVDAKIFAPDAASGGKTLGYDGKFQNVRINTDVGKLPANLVFKSSFTPEFNNPVGVAPDRGTTGTAVGTATFKTLTNDGRPAYFVNVPTKFDFTVTNTVCAATCITPTDEYAAPSRTLTDKGYVLTPYVFKTITRVGEGIPVQYPNAGDRPVDQTLGGTSTSAGTNIPARDFSLRRTGITFSGDVKFDITGGIFGDGYVTTQQLGESLKSCNCSDDSGSSGGNGTYSPGTSSSPSIFVSVVRISTTQYNYNYVDNSRPITIKVVNYPASSGESGESKTNPETINSPQGWYFYSQTSYFNVSLNKNVYVIVGSLKPNDKKVDDKKVDDKKVDDKKVDDKKVDDKKVDDKKSNSDDEIKIDPEKIAYYDPTNGKTYVPIGVASRVFPDMIGLDEVKLEK
jgi:hypothetical protein